MTRGRKRCRFFDNIQAGIEEILQNCTEMGVTPQDSGRELKLTIPGAKSRSASFRNCLAYKELVETYGHIFKITCVVDSEFTISFKEPNHDDEATFEVCGG